jgi:hypothetical protein
VVRDRAEVIPVDSLTPDRAAERVLCGFCQQPFRPTRPHQRFCRPSCRRDAFAVRQEEPDLFTDIHDAIEREVCD